MSAIRREQQNTSPDYWQNCQDIQNLTSDRVQSPSSPDKNIEFVYLPKTTQSPTIVGVAIKRSLKVSDESGLELLDKLQKTVLSHCAPIASTNEIIDANDEFFECNSNYHTDEDITINNVNNNEPNADQLQHEDEFNCENENRYGCDSLKNLFWNKLIATERIADDIHDRTNVKNFENIINLLNDDNESGGNIGGGGGGGSGGRIKINNGIDDGERKCNRGKNVVDKQKMAGSSKDIIVVRHECEVTNNNINDENRNSSHSGADGVMVPLVVVGNSEESIVGNSRDVERNVFCERIEQQDNGWLNCENRFSVKNSVTVDSDGNCAIKEIDCDTFNNGCHHDKENAHSFYEENVIKSTSIEPTSIHSYDNSLINATPSERDVSQTPTSPTLGPKGNDYVNHTECNNEVYSEQINVCFKCNNVCNNIDSAHNIANDILNTETVQCASTSHTSERNVDGNLNLLSTDTATIVPHNPCIAILCGACAQQVTTNNTSYENRQRNKSIHSHEQVENISQDIVVIGGETQSRGNRADSLRTALKIDVVDVIPAIDINQLNQINVQDDVKLKNLKNLCHFLHLQGQNKHQFVEQGVQVPSTPSKCNESSPINCHQSKNDGNETSNKQFTLNELCSDSKSSCKSDHIESASNSVDNNCVRNESFIKCLTSHSDECNNLVSVEESLCEKTEENRLGALHCTENNKKKDISEQCHISGSHVNNDTKHEHRQCSPNCENFEASNRLRRLENRFKDLAFTKKLLQHREDPSVVENWSEKSTLHCSVTDEHHSTSDTVRCASSQLLIDPPTSTIISNYDHSCCRSSIKEVEWKVGRNEQQSKYTPHHHRRPTNGNGNGIDTFSSCDKCGGKIQQRLKPHTTYDNNLDDTQQHHQKELFSISPTKGQLLSVDESNFKSNPSTCKKDFLNENRNDESELNGNVVGEQIISDTLESTADSEEISKLFFEQDISKSEIDDDKSENNVTSATNSLKTILQGGDLHTNCEFDVRHLQDYSTQLGRVFECYDELDFDSNEDDDCSSSSCDCSVEPIVPSVVSYSTMRETIGPLRGLLKNPNRAAPVRKNRVVFDETRNQFFDADYIILIREDCQYDEEDEEPCTCGEHELVRLCCEENCQCTGYSEDNRTPQSPKYAPPIEFVDPAALSPPEGYKDGGSLSNALGGALGGHVFGAQHMQQLQVIQRLQAQRAAMLAARASNGQQGQTAQNVNNSGPIVDSNPSTVCTECAECAECAAKQLQDEECVSPCSDENTTLEVPHVALVPIQTSSPERRITSQKEIIAGEERPKYLLIKQLQEAQEKKKIEPKCEDGMEKIRSAAHQNQSYVVETITMTTVTERRIIREREAIENRTASGQTTTVNKACSETEKTVEDNESNGGVKSTLVTAILQPSIERSTYLNNSSDGKLTTSAQIAGILKGGKLWKSEVTQCEESTNVTSDDEGSKRSVRFTDNTKEDLDEHLLNGRDVCDGQAQNDQNEDDSQSNDAAPMKKHSSLYHNALRPNSAVRQLFPTTVQQQPAAPLTHEVLRAFEDSKKTIMSTVVHPSSDSETDTIRRTIERNALRRSLIKYEPKKKMQRAETSLEERIRRLTCDVDENVNSETDSVQDGFNSNSLERRDSPAGEENPQQPKYDKSFSPSSSASSSSSGSTSAYRKITDIFNRDRRQERIPEADENPIQLQELPCRCPAAPDLGMGIQMPASHTQIHQTPPRQQEARRQFLSTLAPLTSCVAGQRDDLSYYTLAPGDRTSAASSQCSEYSLGDIEAVLQHNDEVKKVAPDVIAGTPGQEQDELAAFAQQEALRTERLKKRYSAETSASAPNSNAGSDDDEQNDYGFNKRPSVRGIKPRFSSTNEILQQMQAQLSTPTHPQTQVQQQIEHSNTLPKTHNHAMQLAATPKNQPTAPNQQIATLPNQTTHQQHIAAWNYLNYNEQHQRHVGAAAHLPGNPNSNYYHHLPINSRHSFGHEEATVYQNCQSQSVAVGQHYGTYARSPTRRPESPPPLRNYHQTMVLIPYNTESYAHFSTNEVAGQPFQRHNVLEYQQVTQQTIRVPMGYPLPGMQLHVVAGRGNAIGAQQYAQYARHQGAQRNYAYLPEKPAVKFTERGVPEGAASVTQSDANNGLMSPTSSNAQSSQNGLHITTQTSTTTQPGVFYAMNV
ncbi:uncharacterized protein LOC119078050 isoform X3 [Bradysia coprophila]|uniref:uncharacterized protein LOC119078050 isoform X3 n=1 Tax=Bradysia coprophila TaxID=38358 RepID=UPI00187DA77A|nr:uncharacterized protein LOC119078050 isoform X3 [Bradysia coprophila]